MLMFTYQFATALGVLITRRGWMLCLCYFGYLQSDVDVDVMMSGLAPFLLCPLLQGPCVGPLRSETNFLRQTPSTCRTGTNASISPGSR